MDKKKGILLVALGTPRSCEADDVRDYLKEFLGDPLVIQNQDGLVADLNGIILKVRPQKSAEMYKKSWTDEGSPLMIYTVAQAKQLQDMREDFDVRFAMTYGEPRIDK